MLCRQVELNNMMHAFWMYIVQPSSSSAHVWGRRWGSHQWFTGGGYCLFGVSRATDKKEVCALVAFEMNRVEVRQTVSLTGSASPDHKLEQPKLPAIMFSAEYIIQTIQWSFFSSEANNSCSYEVATSIGGPIVSDQTRTWLGGIETQNKMKKSPKVIHGFSFS